MSGQTFLADLVNHLKTNYGTDWADVRLVFPNRRAGLFFKQALSQELSAPTWMPQISSMQDFVREHRSYRYPDQLELVSRLYPIYQKVMGSEEAFDRFYYWGEMLLADFNDIDAYMADAEQLFSVLYSQKEIDTRFGDLEEEQRALISRFWVDFDQRDSEQKLKFLHNWKRLYPLYQAFKEELAQTKSAYDGMFYRMLAETLQSGEQTPLEGKVIFAGFNALTKSEERIMAHYINTAKAECLWDLDAYYMGKTYMEAGNFLREYQAKSIFAAGFPKTYPNRILGNTKAISITACADKVAQVKAMADELRHLAKTQNWKAERTAVVLGDESLLMAVLGAIPEEVSKVNVTMGFPLRQSQLYSLLEELVELQRMSRSNKAGVKYFNFRPLMAILRHSLVNAWIGKEGEETVRSILSKNKVWVKQEEISKNEFLTALFQSVEINGFFEYLQALLKRIAKNQDELNTALMDAVYNQLNRLKEVMALQQQAMRWEGLKKLMRSFFSGLRVPFSGEPLLGLQIMGVLETRNLDFEHILFLSADDDSFPGKAVGHSYIPYNLRKAFGLPGLDQHDAIYSYLFYRLLQRSESLQFFYSTQSKEGKGTEMSRYLTQLVYESGLPINRRILENSFEIDTAEELKVAKTEAVMEVLKKRLLLGGEEPYRLSPTAIISYLSCKLQFYLRYVLQLSDADEVQEDIDGALFGNVLHDAMQILFEPYVNKLVEKTTIATIKSELENALDSSFKKYFGVDSKDDYEFLGHQLLIRDLVKDLAKRILEVDEQATPFRILALEDKKNFLVDMEINVEGKPSKIGLKGFIDRVDETEQSVRIIDYKTGKDERSMSDVAKLFESRKSGSMEKAGFQTLFYGMQYLRNFKLPEGKRLEGGLYNLKDIYKSDFDFRLHQGKEPITDMQSMVGELETHLKRCFEEIFDREHAFEQTENTDACKYCEFKVMCRRW